MSDNFRTSRRDVLRATAAAAAATGAAAALVGEARADSFREEAGRYIPPGQWPHHFGLEWYELPSNDPEVIEVWGYTDKLSYAPGEDVAFHVTTGGETFDIQIFRDGAELELAHEAKGVTCERSETPAYA